MAKTPQQEVEQARQRIAAIKSELESTTNALVPVETAHARIDALIANAAANVDREHFELIAYPDHGDRHLSGVSAFELMAWTNPDVLRARLRACAQQSYEGAIALSATERKKKTDALRNELFELEVHEERVVSAAAENGVYINRRKDADPKAILAA